MSTKSGLCRVRDYAELALRTAYVWVIRWRSTPHSQRAAKKARRWSLAVEALPGGGISSTLLGGRLHHRANEAEQVMETMRSAERLADANARSSTTCCCGLRRAPHSRGNSKMPCLAAVLPVATLVQITGESGMSARVSILPQAERPLSRFM